MEEVVILDADGRPVKGMQLDRNTIHLGEANGGYMGCTKESLSRAINGNPTLETLEKIATALGVNITELFDQPKNNTTGITCPHCGKNINIKIEL